MEEESIDGFKKSIESIIGSDTKLKKKKKTELDLKQEHFVQILNSIEDVYNRGVLLEKEFNLNFSDYDEKFWAVIDNLLVFHFGREYSELIFYYIYERLNPDGTINPLVNEKKEEIYLNSANDLWNLIYALKNKKKINKDET